MMVKYRRVIVALVLYVLSLCIFGQTNLAYADSVSERKTVFDIAQKVTDAENELLGTEYTDADRDGSPAFEKVKETLSEWLPDDLNKIVLLWIRQPEKKDDWTWTGSSDVSYVTGQGRRMIWACRDKDTGRIVGVTSGIFDLNNKKFVEMKVYTTSVYQEFQRQVLQLDKIESLANQINELDEK